MKSKVVLLIVSLLTTCVKGITQNISISRKNTTLKEVFKSIEKQTPYSIFYDEVLLKQANKVTVRVKNKPFKEALNLIFDEQPFKYEIVDSNITIGLKNTIPSPIVQIINITGKVTNEKGEPVPGATIEVKGSNQLAVANDSGEFKFSGIHAKASIVITSINYEHKEINLEGQQEVTVQLNRRISDLPDVTIIHTGYQSTQKEESTGSSFTLGKDLINRRVSTNIMDRLDGVTSGLIFNKNIVANTNQSAITIRGRSTIFANPNPLIVVDNFPYTGDIININPNDIETITVLKDAASTAIWGVLSGNGVIVLTTKSGKFNQPVRVSVNSNITVGNKPDLFYTPRLGASDYIDVEQFLFEKGFYSNAENRPDHPALSPVIEILIQKRDGKLSAAEAEMRLNTLRTQDTRKEREKYFYRRSTNQQYAVNASGGGPVYRYYISAGYDKNRESLVRNEYDRKTFMANNTFTLVKNKLELSTNINYTESNSQYNNNDLPGVTYPYLKLADNNGNALTVPLNLRQTYKDTAGQGKLLDWNYRPLDELYLQDNTFKYTDYRINVGLKYTIYKDLIATVFFQHNKGFNEQQNFQSLQTYYTRHLVNQFTQIDPQGTVKRPVPAGSILDQANYTYEGNNLRGQLNYNHNWNNDKHILTAIAGGEVRNTRTQSKSNRLYGYNKDVQSSIPVNYETTFPMYYAPFLTFKVPYNNLQRGTTDRYISYYLNAVYTYQKRYIFSISGRKDESNLFGVEANQKGVPLWSAGAGWIISREKFYHVSSIPFLKLRATSGYNGNVDKSVSAYTTANINRPNVYGAVTGDIINPPNPYLQWEKIYMLNLGLDFATLNKRIEGSLEYYIRKGKNLIGNSPLDPTTGISIFRGNTANMKGQGFDIALQTKNINKQVRWNSVILFSHVTDKITEYKAKTSSVLNVIDPTRITPIEGKPLYSLYSLRWMGLDPQNGDPQGFFNNQVSKEYSSILNSSNFDDLIYNGPVTPTYFGSFRNTISWKQVELSFNITWKAGYYFKRNSINYYNLFLGSPGHPDYTERWQKAGDEKITNIPSLKYPGDFSREGFYSNAEILVEKGDHIRLQDIQLSYDLTKQQISKLPVQLIRFYIYGNNIGLLWKANDKGIDPDFVSVTPNPRTISAGIRVEF